MPILIILIILLVICGRAYWKASDSARKETIKKAFANLKRSKTFWIVIAILAIFIVGRIVSMLLTAKANSQAIGLGYY